MELYLCTKHSFLGAVFFTDFNLQDCCEPCELTRHSDFILEVYAMMRLKLQPQSDGDTRRGIFPRVTMRLFGKLSHLAVDLLSLLETTIQLQVSTQQILRILTGYF